MSCGNCETCSCDPNLKNIQVVSEISAGSLIGSRELPIKRVEIQDDNKITIVVDAR